MKNQYTNRLFIVWGLFISLMLPMLLDGLHYVIFHHHEEDAIQGIQFQNPEKSHILCSFPFVTEELGEAIISVTPYERIIAYFFHTETHLIESIAYFPNPLRGPPNKA